MTALERAKRFVQTNAAKTALVIVPLAVASPAHAASITFNAAGAVAAPMQGGSPGSVSFSGVGSGTFSQIGAENNGVRFVTNTDYVWNDALSASGSGFVELVLSGTGSGTLDADIPAHFDYSYLFSPTLLTNFTSSISFLINGAPVRSFSSLGASANLDFALSGDNGLNWADGDPLNSWEVDLRADFKGTGLTGPLSLHIPPHSVDIVPGGASSQDVPEPATLVLCAAGAGVLAVRRRGPRQRRD